jgi:hypothetical protein
MKRELHSKFAIIFLTAVKSTQSMSCSVSDTDDIDFIMSVQHQLQAFEIKRENNDILKSTPKPRTPGRWLSESSLSPNKNSQIEPPKRPRKSYREPGRWVSDSRLSVNNKSQIDPPRRPKKNDAEPMSYEDFRWKGAMGDEPSALIPTQPMRRKSIGKLVDDFQDVILSMNYCQISVASSHKDVGLSYRTPNIHAAFSA